MRFFSKTISAVIASPTILLLPVGGFVITAAALTAGPAQFAQASVTAHSHDDPQLVGTPAHHVVMGHRFRHYIVQPGNTMSGIAVSFAVPLKTLERDNDARIRNDNLIFVGERVNLPHNASEHPQPEPLAVSGVNQHKDNPTQTPVSGSQNAINGQDNPATTNTGSQSSDVSGGSVSAAPGSFESCVEFRESTDGELSSNLFGFLQSTWSGLGLSGSPNTASPAQQQQAFNQLFAEDGTAPWQPSDGCS